MDSKITGVVIAIGSGEPAKVTIVITGAACLYSYGRSVAADRPLSIVLQNNVRIMFVMTNLPKDFSGILRTAPMVRARARQKGIQGAGQSRVQHKDFQ